MCLHFEEDLTMSVLTLIGLVTAGIWAYLIWARGRFWHGSEWLAYTHLPVDDWPEVVAIIPARDEADVIAETVTTHMNTRYPGPFSVILVDDDSADGTADRAEAAFMAAPEETRRIFKGIAAPALPEGWTGKIAAQQAGVEEAARSAPEAKYYLFTDADISHGPDVLENLVAKAETETRALVSLMARLDDRGIWGGLLVPAFVFFFQKLYPFPLSNDPLQSVAAAAGGCMLVRKEDFEAAGGFEAMRSALIDDCALAQLIKGYDAPHRAIWTGLSVDVTSRRDNRHLTSIWSMVARSAYAQLDYSLMNAWAAGFGFAAWIGMVVTYAPTLILYRQSILNGFALPVAGVLYALMTVSSAVAHRDGRGGQWKGRAYSNLE
jgi:hopene-associated glycosyltransferase HpnB